MKEEFKSNLFENKYDFSIGISCITIFGVWVLIDIFIELSMVEYKILSGARVLFLLIGIYYLGKIWRQNKLRVVIDKSKGTVTGYSFRKNRRLTKYIKDISNFGVSRVGEVVEDISYKHYDSFYINFRDGITMEFLPSRDECKRLVSYLDKILEK